MDKEIGTAQEIKGGFGVINSTHLTGKEAIISKIYFREFAGN